MPQAFAAARVVDTDVVSYLFRGDSRAKDYRPHLDGGLLVVSFMTVAELYRWALERNWGKVRKQRMEEHLSDFVLHPANLSLCRMWAQATDTARRAAKPIGTADGWIAATALLHEVPLVTHNRGHYTGVEGLTVISEAP